MGGEGSRKVIYIIKSTKKKWTPRFADHPDLHESQKKHSAREWPEHSAARASYILAYSRQGYHGEQLVLSLDMIIIV